MSVGVDWYHGICPRVIAERALFSAGQSRENLDGLFLVRTTTRESGEIVLSVMFDSQPWHYKAQHMGGTNYRFYGMEFQSVDELIKHHFHTQGKLLGLLTDPCTQC